MSKMNNVILYHGTEAEYADEILAKGIQPRCETGNSNYTGKIASKKDFVYLTSAWPFFYAYLGRFQEHKPAKQTKDQNDILILKVEVPEYSLFPDEDFIARCMKMQGDERDIRDIMTEISPLDYHHHAADSLEHMGNACALEVKPEQITGHKILKANFWEHSALGADSDPDAHIRIPILKQVVMEKYQRRLKLLFDSGMDAVVKDIEKEMEQYNLKGDSE